MESSEQNIFQALNMFRKLNIGSILPHLCKGEYVLLNGIYHVEKKMGAEHGVGISELTEYMHALPPAVSRTIRTLEQKGYVRRFVNEKDRRNTMVEITESGQRILQESNDIVNDFTGRVFARTDKEELARLIRYINETYMLATEELKKIQETQRREKSGKQDEADH